MSRAAVKVLFITWDGPQTSYLEGLFLPIFAKLREHGYSFHVLQFGWDRQVESRRAAVSRSFEIPYRDVSIQRRLAPLGPLWSAYRGAAHIARAAHDWGIDALMPRSLMPALATLTMRDSSLPVIFDADGFGVDERVDFSGLSPESWSYRLLRDIESRMVRKADHVVVRTDASIPILIARAGPGVESSRFSVVGNGRDPDVFCPSAADSRAAVRQGLGIPNESLLLVYAGSLGEQYCPRAMLDLLEKTHQRHGDARLLVLTHTPELLQSQLSELGSFAQRVIFHACRHDEVAAYLSCADVGIALRQPSFSMQGVSPIKIGEYLLCGLPVVATAGIGKAGVLTGLAGIAVDGTDDAMLDSAADWIAMLPSTDRDVCQAHSRQLGLEHFSLDASAESYALALQKLSLPQGNSRHRNR